MGMEELKAMKAKLDRQEATTGSSGAIPMTPKSILLDADPIREKNPDYDIRWVNTADPSKVARRLRNGYERVPESDGGKTVGNLTAFRIPKGQKEVLVSRLKELNESRLNAHVREMEQMAESEARRLRDQHGIRVRTEDILYKP